MLSNAIEVETSTRWLKNLVVSTSQSSSILPLATAPTIIDALASTTSTGTAMRWFPILLFVLDVEDIFSFTSRLKFALLWV